MRINLKQHNMTTSKSVLLVEDDEDDQQFFTEALKQIENTNLVFVAHNGIEALQNLHSSATLPSIIFMDIDMPAMDGIECLQEIMGNPKTKNIPVIMLSSSTNKIEIALSIGAKAFLKKPNDGRLLREQIEQMLFGNFYSPTLLNYYDKRSA
jgi:CheY-like chemotaxis protein